MDSTQPQDCPRCFHPEAALSCGQVVELEPEEANHLVRVRRVRRGDAFAVYNGAGSVATGVIQTAGKRSATVRIDHLVQADAPIPSIHLVVGVLKQSALENVLQKAVELGAASITWVQTAHSVSQPGDKIARKQERWRDIAIQALKQSGNPWLPKIQHASRVEHCLEKPGVHLIAMLRSSSLRLIDALPVGDEAVHLWIGPEGDFSDDEKEALLAAGATPVTLGATVLRAETAAIAMLAATKAHSVW